MIEVEYELDKRMMVQSISEYVIGYTGVWMVLSLILHFTGLTLHVFDQHVVTMLITFGVFYYRFKMLEEEFLKELELLAIELEQEKNNQKDKD